ncbi:MAG: hypothetical protein RLZZ262_1134 [Bacteroidota bacterium]|jgi:hypothetical protein
MNLVKFTAQLTAMKIIRHFNLYFFLCVSCSIMTAQSKITITAPDSLPFIAVWKNVQLNQTPVYSVTFREDNAGKIPVTLSFPSHPQITVQQTILIKDKTAIGLEISVVKGQHKLVPTFENTYILETPATPEIQKNAALDSLPTTATADSVLSSPTNNADYEDLKQDLTHQTFESRKLQLMINFLHQHSINVDQLRYLMAQLSLEDRKLELLKTALPSILDKTKLSEVTDEFLLDKNKEKARELIGL